MTDLVRELANHLVIRREVHLAVLKLFERVDRQCTLVRLHVYSFPNSEGEAFLWQKALVAARCMMESLPPWPTWYVPEPSDAVLSMQVAILLGME